MNLSEFAINLLLASLIIVINLSFVNTLEFHAYHLEQKISLEDTALRALLSLEQNIHASRVAYCAPPQAIINHTDDITSLSAYQWDTNTLTTYKINSAIYLKKAPPSTVKSFKVDSELSGDFLIVDDCNEAVLSAVTTEYANHETTLTLNKPLGVKFKAPLMLGIIDIHRFEIGKRGLYRKVNQGNRNLIYPNITAIALSKNTLKLTADDQHNHV